MSVWQLKGKAENYSREWECGTVGCLPWKGVLGGVQVCKRKQKQVRKNERAEVVMFESYNKWKYGHYGHSVIMICWRFCTFSKKRKKNLDIFVSFWTFGHYDMLNIPYIFEKKEKKLEQFGSFLRQNGQIGPLKDKDKKMTKRTDRHTDRQTSIL